MTKRARRGLPRRVHRRSSWEEFRKPSRTEAALRAMAARKRGRRGSEEEGKKRSERRRRRAPTKLTSTASSSFTTLSSLPSPLAFAVSSLAAIRRSKVGVGSGRGVDNYLCSSNVPSSNLTIKNKLVLLVPTINSQWDPT